VLLFVGISRGLGVYEEAAVFVTSYVRTGQKRENGRSLKIPRM